MSDDRTCRGCKRGEPCNNCEGRGCGICIKTGLRHTFAEALEHITGASPEQADRIRDRVVDRLR